MVDRLKDIYNERLVEAIQEYYEGQEDEDLSLEEAIIRWLTDGPGEEFREAYLKEFQVADLD
ncbi:MAG: hypothetical protein D6681_06470 [Calditrichaeota bacterium]|nr:MAG: hypothetical protein D6681_06470 [Calditrichota bacterium]